MNNLRQVIKALFCEANSEDILSHNRRTATSSCNYASNVSKSWLIDVLDHNSDGYTRDEIRYLNDVTNNIWLHEPREESKSEIGSRKSVFYSLLHFSNRVLLEENEEPVCRFSQLLRWRDLSYQMGEDIFTLAFLAYKDIKSNRNRNYFSWRHTINNDNDRLRGLLSKGTSELHFHLWGSTFVNEISWISLMNDVTARDVQFNKFKSPKSPATIYGFGGNAPLPLHERCLKAAAIRVYLFQKLHKMDDILTKNICLEELIYSRSKNEVAIYRQDLQGRINCLKNEYGYRLENEVLDYALPANLTERDLNKPHKSNLILAGERSLIYNALKKCYLDSDNNKSYSKDPEFEKLLYCYLIIKNDLRKEMIQVNNRIGFANFAEYQDRKDYFLKDGTIYDKIMGPTAIISTMFDQSIDYLEARIAPKKNIKEQIAAINVCDRKIRSELFRKDLLWKHCKICSKDSSDCSQKGNKLIPEYYFVLHFIKRRYKEDDIKNKLILSQKPRSWALRKDVKEQAFVLNRIRKRHCNTKNRIVGIDAANSEIGHRPELFAQAFRYLRNYSHNFPEEYLWECKFPKLGITYHAGEDYLDLVDGLRSIDEAILFLNYESGDRIGHALALGIDARNYYELKDNTLIMPKHDYIDNLAWLLKKIQLFNIECSSSLQHKLTTEYNRVYYDIYNKTAPDIDLYYQAWLLRGDDPMLYAEIEPCFSIQSKIAITFWDKCGTNSYISDLDIARNNSNIREIIHNYHFNPDAKLKGSISDEFIITDGYDKIVDSLQIKMRDELAKKQIAIECNPTSNQVIGSYKRYANHPLLVFNNYKLHKDKNSCPQLSVSINTDDQGVFSTSLENEYALMAIALEKEKDNDGNAIYTSSYIYDYLEHIRLMGHEQRFIKKQHIRR
ncbi:MAG: hypothetical protein ACRCTF_02510 [Bacteroidales bacterium]